MSKKIDWSQVKERVCTICGETKDISAFRLKNKKTGRRTARCAVCLTAISAKWYADNRALHIKRMLVRNKEKAKKHLEWLLGYFKSHPCVDCGEKDPLVLQFDHVRGERKYDVTDMSGYAKETIEKELAKCDVRCANCHTRRHAKERRLYRSILCQDVPQA